MVLVVGAPLVLVFAAAPRVQVAVVVLALVAAVPMVLVVGTVAMVNSMLQVVCSTAASLY